MSNGGGLATRQVGTYPGFGEVWYDPKAIANIVSQDLVEKAGFDVDYDEHKKEHKVTGKKGSMIFQRSPEGLTCFNVEANAVCMVQTVEGDKVRFTKKEIMKAELAKNFI